MPRYALFDRIDRFVYDMEAPTAEAAIAVAATQSGHRLTLNGTGDAPYRLMPMEDAGEHKTAWIDDERPVYISD